ncbi:MAG: putative minor capsid protein [Rickettsiaceae bacterium]|jgi:signal peptide peptidase SppA|nr:putative minor capsid protein [Rickettsiaceae bacterium]
MDKSQPLYGLITGRPMMLERKAFDYLVSNSKEAIADLKAMDFGRNVRDKPFSVVNGVAIIPVHGPLSKRSGIFDAYFGFTSYELLSESIQEAIDDSDVSAILLDIDSPGGEVAGLFDLCDQIYAARKIKPVWASANEEAYSAAYAIASSAEKLFVTRTGGVGSIGVIASSVDQSIFDQKLGVKVTTVFAGARKNDFNPHEPITSEAVSVLQTEVNRLYDMFVKLVARNRKIAAGNIRNTEAGVFFGPDGVNNGLADDIITMPLVLDLMRKELQPKKASKTMTKPEAEIHNPATQATMDADPKGQVQPDMAAILKEAEARGREAYRAEIMELGKTCTMADMPEKLASFVERNVGVQAAKDELMQILVSQNQYGKGDIHSNVDPLPAGKPKESPVVAAAKARANASI